ncbi:head-tail connector protein [Staphylococcus gallinarum]|uniref:Phage gp6-like head-tail connector protein n=1 Tax=Staphylococcus gallinarum TaxID=1293 RepID=A0A2T4STV9_STAGA|nr:head-tail connector protein [Staphylococcus gallinarum]MBU7217857.1 head-tail connector protein [Staphylococcus gallinarum]PTK95482.1 DNA-packaging protein [Staphylococcus gallinarum]PTK96371.1 DNA-packaging protein [Staphylococcus gallinarum]PTL07811.1 DNA-packaging protein [Staphylococcus gallinarum]RIL22354.1 phage gp6-like head-tail connector protein [Staphylococcus gallinarum]
MFKLDSVESVKKAIRVDHDFDDDLIMEVYLPGAINEVKTAVSLDDEDEAFYENNALFNLAVLNIVAHHNDNRSITTNEQSFDVPASSMALIQTLRSDLVKWRIEKNEVTIDES